MASVPAGPVIAAARPVPASPAFSRPAASGAAGTVPPVASADRPAPAQAEESTSPVAAQGRQPAESTTLFLTIVGDQTFMSYGRSGDRPPAVENPGAAAASGPAPAWSGSDGMAYGTVAAAGAAAADGIAFGAAAGDGGWTSGDQSLAGLNGSGTGASGVVYAPGNGIAPAAGGPAGTAMGADTAGGPAAADPVIQDEPAMAAVESAFVDANAYKPLANAPQACPRTLPPGSDQDTADSLGSQFGCRYLASCSISTRTCTWHYQGQG